MELGDCGVMEDGDVKTTSSDLLCSICLDVITDNGDRAWAKLQCSHHFHLDCIGSAFNAKGMMQCPNCRKVEKGQWLYASGSRPFPEISMDDWVHDEDLYDLGYSEMSFGLHWCPFRGLARLASSFDEGDFPTTAYHDVVGQHAVIAEHTTASSATHPCPYMAFVGPVHPSSSNSNSGISEGLNYNNQWAGQSTPTEMPNSFAFPAPMDVHYPAPFPATSNRVGGADQPSIPSMTQRPGRGNADIPRSAPYAHPVLVRQSSAARIPSLVSSSMIPPYPGSVARARDRAQALQAYFQQPSNNSPAIRTPIVRRSSSRSRAGLPQVGPLTVTSSSDQTHGGVYLFPSSGGSSSSAQNLQESEISMMNPFHHTWERESLPPSLPLGQANMDRQGWCPFHQTGNGPDSSSRPAANFRQRDSTERTMPSLSYHHWL